MTDNPNSFNKPPVTKLTVWTNLPPPCSNVLDQPFVLTDVLRGFGVTLNDRFLRQGCGASVLARLSTRSLPGSKIKRNSRYEINISLNYLSLEELTSLWDIYGAETPHVRKPRTRASVFQIDQLCTQLNLYPFHALFKSAASSEIKWFKLQDQQPGCFTLVRTNAFEHGNSHGTLIPLQQAAHYTHYYLRQRVELKWIFQAVNPAWVLYWNAMKPDAEIDVSRMDYDFLMAGVFWQRVIPAIMSGEDTTGVFDFVIPHFETVAMAARRFDMQLYSSTPGEIEHLFLRVARHFSEVEVIVARSKLKLEADDVKWKFWSKCGRFCNLNQMEQLVELIFQSPLLDLNILVQAWTHALTYALVYKNEKLLFECIGSESYRSPIAIRVLTENMHAGGGLLFKCIASRPEKSADFDNTNLLAASQMKPATAVITVLVEGQAVDKTAAALMGALANSRFFEASEIKTLHNRLTADEVRGVQAFLGTTGQCLKVRLEAAMAVAKD